MSENHQVTDATAQGTPATAEAQTTPPGSQPSSVVEQFRTAIDGLFPNGDVFDGRTKDGKRDRAMRDLMLAMLDMIQSQDCTIFAMKKEHDSVVGGLKTRIEGLLADKGLLKDLLGSARQGTKKYKRAYENAIKAIVTAAMLTRFTGQELADVEASFAHDDTDHPQLVISYQLGNFLFTHTPGDNTVLASAEGLTPMLFDTDREGAFTAKELLALKGLLDLTDDQFQATMESTMPSDALASLFSDDNPADGMAKLFGNFLGGIDPSDNGRTKPNTAANLFAQMGLPNLSDLAGHEDGQPFVQLIPVQGLLEQGGVDAVMQAITDAITGRGRQG